MAAAIVPSTLISGVTGLPCIRQDCLSYGHKEHEQHRRRSTDSSPFTFQRFHPFASHDVSSPLPSDKSYCLVANLTEVTESMTHHRFSSV
jgi:hypothetical protein